MLIYTFNLVFRLLFAVIVFLLRPNVSINDMVLLSCQPRVTVTSCFVYNC